MYILFIVWKSHRIWPILKPIPIRFFKTHRIFRPSYKTFYEEINIHHTFLCFSQASYIKIKVFDYVWGAKSDFCKNLTEFYQIALEHLFYLTDCSPQLMACMNMGVLALCDLKLLSILNIPQLKVVKIVCSCWYNHLQGCPHLIMETSPCENDLANPALTVM